MANEKAVIHIPGTKIDVPQGPALIGVGVVVVALLLIPRKTESADYSDQPQASELRYLSGSLPGGDTTTPPITESTPGVTPANPAARLVALQNRLANINKHVNDPETNRPGNEGFLWVWKRRRDSVMARIAALQGQMTGANISTGLSTSGTPF